MLARLNFRRNLRTFFAAASDCRNSRDFMSTPVGQLMFGSAYIFEREILMPPRDFLVLHIFLPP
jgi:hypothetical protein